MACKDFLHLILNYMYLINKYKCYSTLSGYMVYSRSTLKISPSFTLPATGGDLSTMIGESAIPIVLRSTGNRKKYYNIQYDTKCLMFEYRFLNNS